MNFEFSRKSIREAAARLQKHFPGSTRSAVYEGLANVFGYANWDTFSGVLNKEETLSTVNKVLLTNPVYLYVGAFSTSDFGDSPRWARILLTNEFLANLARLSALCKKEDLFEVSVNDQPEEWQEKADDPLRIQHDSLYVSKTQWWFRAMPKHADYAVETRGIDIELLLAVLLKKGASSYLQWRGDTLVYASTGDVEGFYQELIDDGEMGESG